MFNITDVTINGYRSRFLFNENRNKPTLVFLPGALQDIDALRYYNEMFSKSFNYYLLELPGTGTMPPLPAHKPVSFLADTLDQFSQQYIKGPFYLIACSYGTAIALDYGAKRPEMIKRLVLAGSMLNIPDIEWPKMLQLLNQCFIDRPAFAQGFMQLLTSSKCNSPRQRAIKKAVIKKTKQYSDEQLRCFVNNTLRLMTYEPYDLNSIICPTLCFTGEHDPYTTAERCKGLSKQLPNAIYNSMADTDHLFHIDKPQETISLMMSFLSDQDINTARGGGVYAA